MIVRATGMMWRVTEDATMWTTDANPELLHKTDVAGSVIIEKRSCWLRVAVVVVPVLVITYVGIYHLNLQNQKQINLVHDIQKVPNIKPQEVKDKTPSTLVNNKPPKPNVKVLPVEKKTDIRFGLLRQRNMQIEQLLEEI